MWVLAARWNYLRDSGFQRDHAEDHRIQPPERVALFSSYGLAVFVKLFHPVVSVATMIVHYVLWLLRIKVQTDQSKHKMSMEELRMLVLESEQFLPHRHQKMLLNLVIWAASR